MRRPTAITDHSLATTQKKGALALIPAVLEHFGIDLATLRRAPKEDWRKGLLAAMIQKETTMRLDWMTEQLHMGTRAGVCRLAAEARRRLATDRALRRQVEETSFKAAASIYFGQACIPKIFNSSGADYKSLRLSAKLPAMSEWEALSLLASNGNLVKRPFVIGDDVRLVGFNPAEWEAAFPCIMPRSNKEEEIRGAPAGD